MPQLRVVAPKQTHEASRKGILDPDRLEAVVHGRTQLKTHRLFFPVSLGREGSDELTFALL